MHVVSTPLSAIRRHRTRTIRLVAPAIAAVILATAMVSPVAAAGRTFYIATNGSDSNSGSISKPWRSFHASLKKLRAGDKLYVRGGSYTYSGVNYTGLAGTATNPILVSAYPGERPIFTGTSTPAVFLYFSGNSAYVTLRGMTIQGGGRTSDTNGSSHLGFVGNANHIRIERMRLIGSANWEQRQHLAYVASNSVNDIVFKGNAFDGKGCVCAGMLNFYHDPNATRVAVKDNIFRNGDQGIVIWGDVRGLKIWDNSFTSLRIGIQHHYSDGTTVTQNRGSKLAVPIYVGSKRNLSVYGNSW